MHPSLSTRAPAPRPDDEGSGVRARPTATPRVVAGRYALGSRLGHRSHVFRAVDRRDGAAIALKLQRVDKGVARDRFLDADVAAVRRVEHPNVVRVLDAGADLGRPFVVMELLEGRALTDLKGRLPARAVLPLFVQVCRGLSALHDAGLVHCDLTPQSLFLDSRRRRVKIIDLDLARRGAWPARADGWIGGSPAFASPEQIAGDRPVDHRSDLYSLGVILYRALTGALPFDHRDPLGLLHAHVCEAPRPPSTHVPSLPGALEAILLGLLLKDPRDRPPDARRVGRALERILKDLDASAATRLRGSGRLPL